MHELSEGVCSLRIKVYPSNVSASLTAPPSKSIAHRAIISACLSQGVSHIDNVAYSKDIAATIGGMKSLGATVTQQENHLIIEAIGSVNAESPLVVDCNESGSTLRFFIPIFSLCGKRVELLGKPGLLSRPQSVYAEIFAKQGIFFAQTSESITIEGRLKAGEYELCGDISSQFITGLLLALPLLDRDSVIKIKPPFESRSYVNLTLQTMADFGVEAYFSDDYSIEIKGNQQYHPTDYRVEGDYSQMAFFAVLAAIRGRILLPNMRLDSKQGDREIVSILQSFGVDITHSGDCYNVKQSALFARDIDLSNCPDLGPILTVLCSFSDGKATIYNAARLRIKESDRIEAMENELKKLGVNITSTADSITICGRTPMQGEVKVSAHNDHRIAMSLAVFAACAEFPVTIEGAECVEKSYPNFFEDFKKIGVRFEVIE